MSKAEKTRQYIIEKTAPIFNTKGYAGTSLNDIIHGTGLTKGSIYGNFINKDDVAVAAFEYNLKKVGDIIRKEMQQQKTIKDKLLVYPRVYDNFLKMPFPSGGCPILNTATESDDTHPELKAKASAAIISWKNSLVRLIEKGIEKKEIKEDTNSEQTALSIIALLEGAIMITKLTGKTNYKKILMQSVAEHIEQVLI